MNDIITLAQTLRGKIADLEDMLLESSSYWRCEYCGNVRKESDAVAGRDDICQQCLDASERETEGAYKIESGELKKI